jgi:DNA-binding MarR family transcriptional regulator
MATAKKRRNDGDALTLERFLPYRLSVLANTVGLKVATTYDQRFGISISEWRVMAMLAQHPDISAVDVAERTAMDKVAVSRAVQGLLAKNLIKRETHAEDRRRSMLTLSANGRSVYRRVVPAARAFETRLLDALSVRERKTFGDLLDRLQEQAETLR